MHRLLAASLVVGSLLWSVTLVLGPVALNSRRPRVVSAAAILYGAAGLICHQRPERSYHLSATQLPVCARCTGLYISGAIGALAAWLTARGRVTLSRHARPTLFLAAVPTAATVALEFTGLIASSNNLRAMASLPLGAVAAWVFVRSLLAESPGTP